MNPRDPESITIDIPQDGEAAGAADQPAPPSIEPASLRDLPREVGVLLFSAGVLGFVLPGPGTPAMIAGGLVLWPDKFGKAESWFRNRYPKAHKGGMQYIHRFLDDMERRYPGTST